MSLVRGLLSLPGSSFSPVPGVQGLGNLPGQSLGMPLFPVLSRLPSLSNTCDPKDTVFRPLLAVPGVMRMPPGCFDGDIGGTFSLGAGSCAAFEFTSSSLAFLSSFFEALFASSGPGVPNIACLKALTAN